jgi:hypothetical protein
MSSSNEEAVIVRMNKDGKRLYRQPIFPPPSLPIDGGNNPNPIVITAVSASSISPLPYGENILVLLPTENSFKRNIVESKISTYLGPKRLNRLIIQQLEDISSDVGNQPYDEKGLEGACNRIRNAVDWLMRNGKSVLEEKKVGTVLVVGIENYIERKIVASIVDDSIDRDQGDDNCTAAIDYGIVMIYNATTMKAAAAVSRGVGVQKAFLDEAEALGFDDEERKCGKVTVGEVLAKYFHVDKGNWHEVVCDVSRYVLLQEALERLILPLE